MSAPQPESPGPSGPSRTQVMVLTMLAEIAGTIVIVAVLPFAWSTRLVLVAVYLGLAHFVSRAILGRRDAS